MLFLAFLSLNAKDAAFALSTIVSYAKEGQTPPTLSDYADAGISNVDESILDLLNAHILESEPSDVNSTEKIQNMVERSRNEIVSMLIIVTQSILNDSSSLVNSAVNKISSYAEDSNTTQPPTLQDYINAGISGVSQSNLDAVNQAVSDRSAAETNTPAKIQAIVDGISSGDTEPPLFFTPENINIEENRRHVIEVETNDTSAVTYSLLNDQDSGLFTIDTQTGSLDFLSAPDFEYPEDTDADNTYVVTVKATDRQDNSAMKTLHINVTDDPSYHDPIPMHGQVSIHYLAQQTASGTFKVDLGNTAKTLYIVFTNNNSTETSNINIVHQSQKKTASATLNTKKTVSLKKDIKQPKHAPESIRQTNMDTLNKLHSGQYRSQKKVDSSISRRSSTVGDSHTFYLSADTSESTEATLKKMYDVNTSFGTKRFFIWVSDDSFDNGNGCRKSKCITQAQVDTLADKFLKDGENNDIYDWVTNLYGEEWGDEPSQEYSNVIAENNEITILLTDIDNDDSPDGGTIGYFYAKDNLTTDTYSGSNERIMFYIDSVMYGNNDDGDDYWQNETYATLAHEFQHMINYYQHSLLRSQGYEEPWIDEMLSETTEDVVATKLHHNGPRAVSYLDGSAGDPGNVEGRYPSFNDYNWVTLPEWQYGDDADYGKVSAFGTFLIRNYGGVKLLRDIMYESSDDISAIEAAVEKENNTPVSFGMLMRKWASAVILSDKTDLPLNTPQYNTGDFKESTFGNITYELGSINFFNYTPQPKIYTESGKVDPQANYYYKVGVGLSGIIDVNITADTNTTATFIAK